MAGGLFCRYAPVMHRSRNVVCRGDRARDESVDDRACADDLARLHCAEHDLIGVSRQHINMFAASAIEQASPARNRRAVANGSVIAIAPQRNVVIPEQRIAPSS